MLNYWILFSTHHISYIISLQQSKKICKKHFFYVRTSVYNTCRTSYFFIKHHISLSLTLSLQLITCTISLYFTCHHVPSPLVLLFNSIFFSITFESLLLLFLLLLLEVKVVSFANSFSSSPINDMSPDPF